MKEDTTVAGPSMSMAEKHNMKLPIRPEPIATRPHSDTSQAREETYPHNDTRRPYPGTSFSTTRTADSIDLEKGILGEEVVAPSPGRRSKRSHRSHRLEMRERDRGGSEMSAAGSVHRLSSDRINDVEEESAEDENLEDKAMRILVSPLPIHSNCPFRSQTTSTDVPPALPLRPSSCPLLPHLSLDHPLLTPHYPPRSPTPLHPQPTNLSRPNDLAPRSLTRAADAMYLRLDQRCCRFQRPGAGPGIAGFAHISDRHCDLELDRRHILVFRNDGGQSGWAGWTE